MPITSVYAPEHMLLGPATKALLLHAPAQSTATASTILLQLLDGIALLQSWQPQAPLTC